MLQCRNWIKYSVIDIPLVIDPLEENLIIYVTRFAVEFFIFAQWFQKGTLQLKVWTTATGREKNFFSRVSMTKGDQ